MSKGSTSRPFSVPREQFESNYDAIDWGKPSKCPVCNENIPRCICAPTDDGPGQEEADKEDEE